MAPHFIVQASGAMFAEIPTDWTFVFGIFVAAEEGTPVQGLTKENFSVWRLANIVTDISARH
jgi:hypothetical protein